MTLESKGIVSAAMSVVFIAVTVASVSVRVAPHISAGAFFVTLCEDETQAQTENTTESAPVRDSEPESTGQAGKYEIVPVNISFSDGSGEILFKNETKYSFSQDEIANGEYPVKPCGDGDPTVLIVHTHATESYAQEGAQTVTETRSDDGEKNMLAVGKVICDRLEENGVHAVQCRKMHDAVSYNEAYNLSLESVQEYLKKYPTIKYIIDVHRDAIETEGGAMAKPVTENDGTALAQMMLVVGTNEAGADHPGWHKNLCVAMKLQQKLMERNENLMRPINLRSASFNQQYSNGFLLLEVGSCANTLSEAVASARIFADALAVQAKNGG